MEGEAFFLENYPTLSFGWEKQDLSHSEATCQGIVWLMLYVSLAIMTPTPPVILKNENAGKEMYQL